MKSIISILALFSILLLNNTIVFAQVAAVTFTVKVPVPDSGAKNVYIAGSFNSWNAGDSLYRLHQTGDGLYTITLPLFEGKKYEYKYTLGNWDRVEQALNDSDIHNRSFISVNEKNITDTIMKWKHPQPGTGNNNPQMQKFNAMKDSALANMKPGLNNMIQLFKEYVQNFLQEKPSEKKHKQLDKKAEKQLNQSYEQITKLLWNIMATLTPEQKKEIQNLMDKSNNKEDVLNTFLNAFNGVLEGKSAKP